MSKSDPLEASRISLDDSADAIKKKISKAVTDGEKRMVYDPEGRPGVANLLGILAAMKMEMKERENGNGAPIEIMLSGDTAYVFFSQMTHARKKI